MRVRKIFSPLKQSNLNLKAALNEVGNWTSNTTVNRTRDLGPRYAVTESGNLLILPLIEHGNWSSCVALAQDSHPTRNTERTEHRDLKHLFSDRTWESVCFLRADKRGDLELSTCCESI